MNTDDFIDGMSLKERLRGLPEEDFFKTMLRSFTEDTRPARMEAAILVMEERFANLSKPAQLTGALVAAVRKDNVFMVDYLLAQGALIDGTKNGYLPGLPAAAVWCPLAAAVSDGSREMVEHLLQRGAEPNPPGNLFIYEAAYMTGSAEKTRILLDAGARGGAERALRNVILVDPQFEIADMILEKTNIGVNVNNGDIVKSAVMSLSRQDPNAGKAAQYLSSRGADFESVAESFESKDSPYPLSRDFAQVARACHAAQEKLAKKVRPSNPKN